VDDGSRSHAGQPGEHRRHAAGAAQRKLEIAERLRRLRTTVRAIEQRRGHGSTAADVATAQQSADQARKYAAAAHEHAAHSHEQAAAVHERAAALFAEHGDEVSARRHRDAAAADRAAAAADRDRVRGRSDLIDAHPSGRSAAPLDPTDQCPEASGASSGSGRGAGFDCVAVERIRAIQIAPF
jgi:hypothetical protein